LRSRSRSRDDSTALADRFRGERNFSRDRGRRSVELFKESPGAYLGLFLREVEAWLKSTFNGE
jgi:hypothetical protein